MQSYVKVRDIPRICMIVILLVFVVALPVSAVSEPTINSVTPSTTSVVNGGTVIFTVVGSCGTQITYGKYEMKNPQGWNTIAGLFDTTTNGNQWSGKFSYTFSPSLQSGQYKLWRITVQDSAGNFASKELVPEVVINVDNSVTVQPPTIISVTPSTTSVVNGGTVIFTVSGNSGTQITNGKYEMKNPQGLNTIAGFIDTTTNGNQWSGKFSYTFSPSLQSGQYKLWRISVQDSAGNFASKELVPEVVINVDNSGQSTPTWTPNQIAAPKISSIPPFTPQIVNTPYPLVTPTWTSNQIVAPTVSPIPPFTPPLNTQTPPQTQPQTKTTPLLYAPIGAIVLMVGIAIWSRQKK